MIQEFNNIKKVEGELELPGDKSISHRAVIFSSLAKGKSVIYNLSNGEDVKTTQDCFKSLGIIIKTRKNSVEVIGSGFKGLKKADNLYLGNSGTTTRLICGILIAQNFESYLTGDDSLSKRPMKRILDPLTSMGGKIEASQNFTLPIKIFPSEKLKAIDYDLPIASAQIKSSVLLAGLHLDKETSVIEKFPSRNHTEKMLGLKVIHKNGKIISFSSKKDYPLRKEYFVPSDISTAAFFIILTLVSKNSSLIIKNVSLNETRTGILKVLKKMGAVIEIENIKGEDSEPYGNLKIISSSLKNINIEEEIIPNIIDEIPILSIAGIFAEGKFEIRNAGELRAKETDRIKALCCNFQELGLTVEEYQDGFKIYGSVKNNKPVFESFGDHRIAMSFGILSLLLKDGGKVNNFNCVNISNPDFISQLTKIIR